MIDACAAALPTVGDDRGGAAEQRRPRRRGDRRDQDLARSGAVEVRGSTHHTDEAGRAARRSRRAAETMAPSDRAPPTMPGNDAHRRHRTGPRRPTKSGGTSCACSFAKRAAAGGVDARWRGRWIRAPPGLGAGQEEHVVGVADPPPATSASPMRRTARRITGQGASGRWTCSSRIGIRCWARRVAVGTRVGVSVSGQRGRTPPPRRAGAPRPPLVLRAVRRRRRRHGRPVGPTSRVTPGPRAPAPAPSNPARSGRWLPPGARRDDRR